MFESVGDNALPTSNLTSELSVRNGNNLIEHFLYLVSFFLSFGHPVKVGNMKGLFVILFSYLG